MEVLSRITAFIFTLIFVGGVFAQSEQQIIIARIGSEEITEDIFLERYELTPQVNAALPGASESLKREVLYSIIAEKLWAIEAEELGLSNSELIKSTYKAIEKMYVRDALYREEIINKIQLTDSYLNEAFRRNNQILKLNYLFSTSEDEIKQLYEVLVGGASFDSLLILRPEARLQVEPYVVNYGQMDKEVEDILYKLKVGNFTLPVKAPNGWYIFELISVEEKIISNAEQAEAEEKNVLKIARATITDSIYRKYYSETFSDVDARTNGELFTDLSNSVIRIFQEKRENESESNEQKIYLSSDDLYEIEFELGPEKLNSEFVMLDDQPLTLNEFLQELAFEKFSVDTLSVDLIKSKLNLFVKRFIEHELFAREGYRRGYQNLPEVKRYLKMWKSYYMSDALRTKISGDIHISDEEVKKYLNEKDMNGASSVEVKIIELLTDDLDIIRSVLDKLNEEEDFRALAQKFTIREEAKKKQW